MKITTLHVIDQPLVDELTTIVNELWVVLICHNIQAKEIELTDKQRDLFDRIIT